MGDYIKKIIKYDRKLKIFMVAERMGMNEKTFSGKLIRNNLSADELMNLSIILNIDLNELKEKYNNN